MLSFSLFWGLVQITWELGCRTHFKDSSRCAVRRLVTRHVTSEDGWVVHQLWETVASVRISNRYCLWLFLHFDLSRKGIDTGGSDNSSISRMVLEKLHRSRDKKCRDFNAICRSNILGREPSLSIEVTLMIFLSTVWRVYLAACGISFLLRNHRSWEGGREVGSLSDRRGFFKFFCFCVVLRTDCH